MCALKRLEGILSCPRVALCAVLRRGSESFGVEASDVGLCHDGAVVVSNERRGWQMRQLEHYACRTHYEGLIVWICRDAAGI